MNTSGDRLRILLRECHLSATDFAANRKVTPQHVNNWFKRGIPMARMEEVAELLSVNVRWLRSGEGPKHPGDTRDKHGTDGPGRRRGERPGDREELELPLYTELQTQPSGRACVAEAPHQKIRLARRILDAMDVELHNAICVAMVGSSMADKIQDGSLMGVDRGRVQIIDGEMYALEHAGMLRVKYLYRLPGGGLRLRSHNAAEYPDEIFSAEQVQEQRIHVLGWIFWWSTLNHRRHPAALP
ncbi:XRE family transcriptional regulator [Pseudomonas sp. GD03842]|uniref:LexA family transcriptional regulator n=1 Tax=unclassified Pseudomonas TaxID=196821 RepID=UPI000D3D5D11|nr:MULTISPECIES: XRE family transcriptional regulator [unclassified Pseudomonas]MDH0749095.1 XRE family transcriptional regulator [Pseudomonas sp. GD03842]RAU42436.1 XRE family transcriptional regulator [Pseudomonas sp. RIT 409]RAU50633.1 XRE family transcriptional regulator [Pseudomonas sp. RIT 412]